MVFLLLGLGVMMVGALYLFQRSILFAGSLSNPVPTAAAHQGVEVWQLDTPEGSVEVWYAPAPGASAEHPAPAVIHAHGNGEVIDWWWPTLEPYHDRGVSVLLVEYRGYGRSAGSPTQDAIVEDFVAAYDVLATRPEVDATRIIGHGRSLGGGAVAQLAARRPLAGLMLESCYTSVADVAWDMFWAPRFLVSDPFDVRTVLETYSGPVLIVHGMRDGNIEPHHAQANAAAAGDRAELVWLDAGHNDPMPEARYWAAIGRLLERVDRRVVERRSQADPGLR